MRFSFDPRRQVFVECSKAAFDTMRATGKQQQQLLRRCKKYPFKSCDGRLAKTTAR
jgi:hypothetical protein